MLAPPYRLRGSGENFFKALVENLAKVLNIRGAWGTEYDKENRQLNSLAFWMGGQWVEQYNYDIAGTPCEPVVEEKELIHVAENVLELYPNDTDLESLDAVSYIGVPLLDLNGCVLGHLAVFDTKLLPEESWVNSVFNIFAARASAELQRINAEYDVREREEKLSRLVDSAMDALANHSVIPHRAVVISRPAYLYYPACSSHPNSISPIQVLRQAPLTGWLQSFFVITS